MKVEWRYALLIALFEVVRLFTEYHIGLQGKYLEYGWISSFVLIVFIVGSIYYAVDDNLTLAAGAQNPVLIGAKTGFFVMLLAGALMAGAHYLFFKYYNTGYFEVLIAYAKDAGLSSKELTQIYRLPNHLRMFIFYPSYGLVLGAISAWILRKRRQRV